MLPTKQSDLGLPLRRFRPPVSADVQLQQNRPAAIRSSILQGRILHSSGPWRSSGDWWDKQLWQRDEWDIQIANGQLFRLYREHDTWFVEGIYD